MANAPTKFIGISGASGSGKSTFARQLQLLLPDCSIFSSDSYFKTELPTMISPLDGREYPDYNHPSSIEKEALLRDLAQAGGKFVLVEGAYLYCFPELLKKLHFKIYIDAAIETRFFRRIRRNLQAGQDLDFIGGYYLNCARFREKEYSLPSRKYADLIVENEREFSPSVKEVAALITDH